MVQGRKKQLCKYSFTDYNEWVCEYMLRLISVVVIRVDYMKSPSLFILLVRMTMGVSIMAWGHAMNGISTHHCSCDNVNGCTHYCL